MKKIVCFLFLCATSMNALFAQAPEKMSYQAVIRAADNTLLKDAKIGMQISILSGSVDGNPVYQESHEATTNTNGLVSLEIGTGTVVSGSFASIDWSAGPFFIKTETDPAGGENYTLTGTSQLLSVPYALHAKTAESVLNVTSSPTHYVGEVFGGGVVFHVYIGADGLEHGLIVSLADQGIEIPWTNLNILPIGETARSSWNGLANSTAIINQGGHNLSAAQLCFDYNSTDGFDDWYLPSIDELTLLYTRRFDVNRVLQVVGEEIKLSDPNQDFNYIHYWSSTEINGSQSWRYSFTPGANDFSHFALKSSLNNVRAIRSF